MKWLHLSMFSFDICKCFPNPTQHSHFIQSTYSVIEIGSQIKLKQQSNNHLNINIASVI
jgi:hypothetical protein